RKGSVIEAVRASISTPGVFVPVTLEGRCLVDGGLTNPIPADIVRDMGAKFIIAVNVLVEPQKRARPVSPPKGDEMTDVPNIFNTLIQSIYIMEHEIVSTRIPRADIIISPDVSRIESFEFHKGEEAILAGYEAARNALPRLQRLIGKR
ncbi:MAG: patatin-like phospholipase family protein, partial [Dehalococcoidia bacterium]|nr:patatin-like phospholipase family protein [Dehalococcoidia bacterium]